MQETQVIRLSRRDTLDAICQAIADLPPNTSVWLVAPWRLGITRHLFNLKRLRHAADRAHVMVHLVSAHRETRLLAREAGLIAHFALPFRLRRAVHRLGNLPGHSAPLIARRAIIQGVLEKRFGYRRRLSLGGALAGLLAILFLVATGVLAFVAFVPEAEVNIQPVARAVSTSFRVRASPVFREVDYSGAVIPARPVQVIVEERAEEPATGGLDVPDGYASGEVIFANRTNQPVLVPKGTIVRTGSGVNARFATVSDVEVPGQLYAHARVGIVALDPGPVGNAQPLTINIVEGDIGYKVDVLNVNPTQGGTVRRAPVVLAEDFERLSAKLLEQLTQNAYAQLVNELEEGEFIPAQSLDVRIMSQTYDQVVGQRSDVASMSMKVVARGTAVDGKALEDLATQFLIQQNAEGEELQVIPGSLVIRRGEEIEKDRDEILFNVQARGMVTPVIHIPRLQAHLRGKTAVDAEQWLRENLSLASPPQVSIRPSWWERLPWLPARLKVHIIAGET